MKRSTSQRRCKHSGHSGWALHVTQAARTEGKADDVLFLHSYCDHMPCKRMTFHKQANRAQRLHRRMRKCLRINPASHMPC